MQCKICKSATQVVTNKCILNKYPTNYHQCVNCNFIQTDEPFWLKEAYSSAITALDIGLINRNNYLQQHIPKIIDTCFPDAKTMIDFGGGYGIFVRMMRDLGYDFFRQDTYCQNLFAKYFDVTDTSIKRFDVLTTFEVFEHLEHPMEEIEKMLTFSENIIFSTVLLPTTIKEFESWWYVSPLIGQHISFYDQTTLQYIAKAFGKKLYTNHVNLHILTAHEIDPDKISHVFNDPKKLLLQRIVDRLFPKTLLQQSRVSLLQKDYEFIERKLTGKN